MRTPAKSAVATVVAAATVGLGMVGGASSQSPTAVDPVVERVVYIEGPGRLKAVAPSGSPAQRLSPSTSDARAPSWSPDGTLVAFVRSDVANRSLYVMNADGTGLRRVGAVREAVTDTAWSPDGRSLAYAVHNQLLTVQLGTGARRVVATRGEQINGISWSPDASRIVFSASNADGTTHLFVVGSVGGVTTPLTDGAAVDLAPSWSPRGDLIAFARRDVASRVAQLFVVRPDGSSPRQLFVDTETHADPTWSPGAGRLAFSRGDGDDSEIYTIRVDGSDLRRLTTNTTSDTEPEWGLVRTKRALLPDLDQRAPSALSVSATGGRFKLGFTSATDNIGIGPIWIRGTRRTARGPMTATQLIQLAGRGVRRAADVGHMRYTTSFPHRHFHFLRFQSYELRRADNFSIIATDRKSGFCLADHYGLARSRVREFGPPRFLSNCGQDRPTLRSAEHGTSIGYTDRYPAYFHGQNVDVTNVAAGRYWLVHRANPSYRLRELSYGNNAAAVMVELTWPHGRRVAPRVKVLRRCERTERC